MSVSPVSVYKAQNELNDSFWFPFKPLPYLSAKRTEGIEKKWNEMRRKENNSTSYYFDWFVLIDIYLSWLKTSRILSTIRFH